METSACIGDPKTSTDNEGILCEEEDSCKCKPSTSQKASYVDRSTYMENIDAADDGKDNGYSRICKDAHTSRKRLVYTNSCSAESQAEHPFSLLWEC